MNMRIDSSSRRAVALGCLLLLSFIAGAASAQGIYPGPQPLPDVSVRVSGTVEVVAPYGSGFVLGGSFDTVNGQPRSNIAVVDASGALADAALAWSAAGADGTVRALAVSGTQVFVGGDFASIGGQARGFLAKLSLDSGDAADDDVDDAFAPVLDGAVHALALDGSGGLFAGGRFETINDMPRDGAAHIDGGSGAVAAGWVPGYHSADVVNALVLDGGVLYVGGRLKMTTGGGSANHNRAIGRLDAATGARDNDWRVLMHPKGGAEVRSIAVGDTQVWFGGQFREIQGSIRSNLASVSKAPVGDTAPLLPWNPGADGLVRAIVADASGTLVAGGDFATLGGAARLRLGQVGTDGLATAFSADADRPIRAIADTGTGQLVVGGAFHLLDGQQESGLARVAFADGTPDAGFTTTVAGPGGVNAVAVDDDGSVIVGGEFDAVVDELGGQHVLTNVLRLNPDLTLDSAWSANVRGDVQAVAIDTAADRLYLGGSFTSVEDAANAAVAVRTRLAAYDISGAAPVLDGTWTPAASGDVTGLVVDANGLYVHGLFLSLTGSTGLPTTPSYVGRLDGAGLVDSSWLPAADGPVLALAVDGDTVVLGGNFTSMGGSGRDNLARVHAVDDIGLGFTAGEDAGLSADTDGPVRALTAHAGVVYVGGEFDFVGGLGRSGAARLDGTSVDGWNPAVAGGVHALAESGGWMYMGGDFATAGGDPHPNLVRAATDDADGAADRGWRPGTDAPVRALAGLPGGDVLAGGPFHAVTGVARGGLASIGPDGSDFTEVSVATGPNPSTVGQTWTVSFSVSNLDGGAVPSGTVTVGTDAGESCAAPVVLDGSGAGSCQITSTSAGVRNVTASFVSDSIEVLDDSTTVPHPVDKASVMLTVTTGPDPSEVNADVFAVISLDVLPPGVGTPTGSVAVGSTNIAGGAAGPGCTIVLPALSCTLNFTATGFYFVSANYSGDDNFAAVATLFPDTHQVVADVIAVATTTTVDGTTPAPSVFGSSYDVAVSVEPDAIGSVTIDDGDGNSCVATLLPGAGGSGSCALPSAAVGDRSITATFAANASFEGSVGSGSHTVAQAATELELAVQSSILTEGDAAVFTWNLAVVAPGAGTPTGLVTVSDGALSCSAEAALGGCSIPGMAAGMYAFTAAYAGDVNFLGDATDGSVPVTVAAGGGGIPADIVVRHEIVRSGVLSDGSGDLVDYELEVRNDGGVDAFGVDVDMLMPAEFVQIDWTCSDAGGGSCGQAAGAGDIGFAVDLPAMSSVLIELSVRIVDLQDRGVETAAMAATVVDELDTTNNQGTTFYRACSGSELLVMGEFTTLPPHVCGFRDGFEDRGID